MNEVHIEVTADDHTKPGFLSAKRQAASFGDGVSKMLSGLKGIAVAAGADLASSLAGPLVAATGATVAAFASAGAAVGAFGLAAAPQLKLVTDLTADLSKMPPATREAAVAFRGLRGDFLKWSDSLTGDTMPVFTKGIGVLRTLLPSLTPLVKAGASALSGFMDTLQRDAQGGGVARFTGQLADAARKVLPGLLNSLRNVAIGFGGIVSAFLPFADDMSGGLEDLTAKFADWGQSLGDNQAFQDWMSDISDQAPDILDMLGDLVTIIGNVAEAMAPFTGVTLKVTEALADFVAAIPQDVMDWLAPTIGGIVLAIKAWSVAQGILNIALAANPIGLVVLALAALVGGLIYAYKHSETFRRIVDKAFSVVKEKGGEMWEKIKPGLEKMGQLLGEALPEAASILAEGLQELADKAQEVADKVLGINVSLGETPDGGGFSDLLDEWADKLTSFNDKVIHVTAKVAGSDAVQYLADKLTQLNGKVVQVAAKVAGSGPVQYLTDKITALNGKVVQVAARVAGSGPVKTLIGWIKRLGGKVVRVGASVFGAGAVQNLIGWIRNLSGKVVNVGANILGFASGGISHAAEGGPRGNLAMVGEHGRELVRLPFGSSVIPNGQTENMLAAAGGGGAVRLVWSGAPGDEVGKALWEWFKKNVRIEGGGGDDSVQKALGD